MNYATLSYNLKRAKEDLSVALKKSITSSGNTKGAGQFIKTQQTSDHIGIYGTSAILETIGFYEPIFLNKELDNYLAPLDGLINPVTDDAKIDSTLTLKLCAGINALKYLDSAAKNEKSTILLKSLVSVLMSMTIRDEIKKTQYWPYSSSDTKDDVRHYILPTAYALNALNDQVPPNQVSGGIKFLCYYLREQFTNQSSIKPHELISIMLALRGFSAERAKHITDKEFQNAEFFLYRYFVQDSDKYNEIFVNYVSSTSKKFVSLFYVVKTDLMILKYFLISESKYLESNEVFKKIKLLIERICNDKMYINSENKQASVRENALAFRIISELDSKSHHYHTSRLRTFQFKFKWSPSKNIAIITGRILSIFGVLAPIIYTCFQGQSLVNFTAVASGILSSFAYDYLKRK